MLVPEPTDVETDATPIPPPNPNPSTPMADVPASPYDIPDDACSGTRIEVRGFPSSPFKVTPFVQPFQNPVAAQKAFTQCTTAAGKACADVYNIDIVETSLDLRVGCSGLTRVLSYNGSVPGPTITVAAGRQSLVRFNNRVPTDSSTYPQHPPCHTTTRKVRHVAADAEQCVQLTHDRRNRLTTN
jgi:hypothetical protein